MSSVPAFGTERQSFHDLATLAEEVRREYFPEMKSLSVRWGHRIRRKKRRSIRLGSYNHETTEIRIHPLLDAPAVPRFFIQSIIHHEYLHHVLGGNHDRRFRRHEQMFRFHRESAAWLKKNLHDLLGRKKPVRRKQPMVPLPGESPVIPPPPIPAKPVQLALF